MLRRVIIALASVAGGWVLLGQPAGADYPPVPPAVTTTIVAPAALPEVVSQPRVVVVVRGAPVAPPRALVRTGTSSTSPLAALATASVGLGVTLVCLTRLRGPGHRRHRHHQRRFV